jgi:hypothetical protein
MADLNSKESCNSCKFFLSQENDFMGSCRRFPTFQNRHGTEWCGEFVVVPPNPVFETMIQDIEIAIQTDPKEKRKRIMEEAGNIEPKPRGRPKKVVE